MVTSRTRSTERATSHPLGRDAGIDWRLVTVALGSVLFLYYLIPLASLVFSLEGNLLEQMSRRYVVVAATNSLVAASASTLIAVGFGLPLAYWLARTDFRGRDLVMTVVVLPLVLPPVVSGMLLLGVVGPAGLGGLLDVRLTRSLVGVILAQTFVASPFLVVTARAAFQGVDRQLEYASRSLGKDRWTTIRRVTLPLAWPGILAGVTLTFARAIGEFGATLMLAYYPRTLPVQIWVSYLSTGLDAAWPIAVVLLGVALGTLLIIHALGKDPWR